MSGVVRLTLIAAASVVGGPDAALGADDPGDAAALARLRARHWIPPTRAQALSSPARAARDTAAALDLVEPTVDPALRDRDHGAWAGRRMAELGAGEPAFGRWLADPAFAPPGGETVVGLVARAAAWLDQLGAPASVVAISHPAPIRAFVVAALACAPAAWFRLDVGHGTRTVLTRNGPTWRVALVNAPVSAAQPGRFREMPSS